MDQLMPLLRFKESAREIPLSRSTFAFLLAAFVAFRGVRKRSLTRNGAFAAFIVGFLSLAASLRFGFLLLLFYFTSSKLTRYHQAEKEKHTDDYKTGGQRTVQQVLACSLLGTVLAVVHVSYFGDDKFAVASLPTSLSAYKFMHTFLHCAYIAHYACCNGDTWASELGILSKNRPVFILTGRGVPRGTNGGVSLFGTIISAVAGGVIGVGYLLVSGFTIFPTQDPICEQSIRLLALSVLAGLVGSLIDSLLGATLQATYYDEDKKMVVVDPTPQDCSSGRVQVLCGRALLSNVQVNLVSTFVTTGLGGLFGVWLLG